MPRRLTMSAKLISGPAAWFKLLEARAKANGENFSAYLMRLGLVDCGRPDLIDRRPNGGTPRNPITAEVIRAEQAAGKSIDQIAKDHKTSKRTVYKRLARND